MANKNNFVICIKCETRKLHHAKNMCHVCYSRERYELVKSRKKETSRQYYLKNKSEKLKYNCERYKLGFDKARKQAKYLNLKGDICEKCDSKENLEFHHTDYIKNIGLTLCKKCHTLEHRKK